jgi:LEA14-like dessication related protein
MRRVVLALMVLAVAGCEGTWPDAWRDVPRPTARLLDVDFEGLGLKSVKLEFDVEVDNPYTVDLPLVDMKYDVKSDGRRFVRGEADLDGVIPAGGKRELELPVRMGYVTLFRALSGVGFGDVIPYEAEVELSVDAPVLGRVALPMRGSGRARIPRPSIGMR